MGNENWILFRAYTPAAALFGLALLVSVFLGELSVAPLVGNIVDVLRWIPIAM